MAHAMYSTMNYTVGSPTPQKDYAIIGIILDRGFGSTIAIIGLVNNVLSFLIMNSRHYRQNVSCFCLKILAVIDLFSLFEYLLVQIWYSVPFAFRQLVGSFFCVQLFWVVNSTVNMSAWTLVYIAATRFVAVVYPLKSATWCTKKKANIFFVFNVLIFFTWEIKNVVWRRYFEDLSNPRFFCYILEEYAAVALQLYMVQTSLYIFIPWILIAFANLYTILTLTRRHDDVIWMSRVDRKSNSGTADERSITRMLLLTMFAFLVLMLPYCVYTIFWDVFYHSVALSENMILIRLIHYKISLIMTNANHAVNFYMYCAACKKFRQSLWEMLSLRSRKN
jgi:hypothetical protein